MNIQIQQATTDDLQIIQKLNNEVFEDNLQYDRDLNMKWPYQPQGLAYYKKIASSPDYCVLIAYDGEIPAGHIVGGPNLTIDYRLSKAAEIHEMGVSPSYRSNGIGTMLVRALRAWFKKSGYTKVRVNAYFSNERAIAFYKKQGLQPIDMNLEMDI